MSTVSTKGTYGLAAMVILSREYEQKLLQIKEIASKADIPQNYLEQILVILKRAGLVESIRGANGGYRLIKLSKDIKVYEILHALDCCVSYSDSKISKSLLGPFWNNIQDQVKEMFSLTLEELVKFLDDNNENIVYSI